MKKICINCLEEFEDNSKFHKRKYCSEECGCEYNKKLHSPSTGIKVCHNCKKEYFYTNGQSNWTKDGVGNGRSTIRSDKFCCYQCGIEDKSKNSKQTCLKKYGIESINKLKDVKIKKEKTYLKKYGVNNPAKSKEVKEKTKQTNLEKYGVEYSCLSENNKIKRKNTWLKKYGVDHPFKAEKVKNKIKNTVLNNDPNYKNMIKHLKQTNLERYGVESTAQLESVKEKMKKTCLEKYGVDNYSKTEEFKNRFLDPNFRENISNKQYNTKKKNKTFKISKFEEQIYQLLLQKYFKVERQYKSDKYPFACDFYIPSLDLYIEYQGTWTHGKEPFNKDNKEHIKQIELWKKRSEDINCKGQKKNYYINAIRVWTIFDPKKRQTARENNLNWIEFFNLEEFLNWYKGE